jgi:uncharacterized membrane protein YkoI
MMKKFTLPLIIIILILVSCSGCVNFKTNNTTQNNTINQSNQKNNNVSSNQTNITAAEAQEIASRYIEQAGAVAGTPQLTTIDGQQIYIVPIIYKGQTVGQIEIDAQSGANIGGAGGVT